MMFGVQPRSSGPLAQRIQAAVAQDRRAERLARLAEERAEAQRADAAREANRSNVADRLKEAEAALAEAQAKIAADEAEIADARAMIQTLQEKLRIDLAGPRRSIAKEIIKEVAEQHGLRVADLCGQGRYRAVVIARHEAIYRISLDCPHLSYPAIGKMFGGRDHTTILHAVRTHARRNGLDYVPRVGPASGSQPR